jgi:hypothetical protein
MFAVFIFICVIVVVLITLFGEYFVGLLPSVRKLKRVKNGCKNWHFKGNIAKREVSEMFSKRYEEVAISQNNVLRDVEKAEIGDLKFGSVAVLVHYKEKRIRSATRELRFYSGIFLLIFIFGSLWAVGQGGAKVNDFSSVVTYLMGVHIFPILEAMMISLWLIRVVSEVRSINEILEP